METDRIPDYYAKRQAEEDKRSAERWEKLVRKRKPGRPRVAVKTRSTTQIRVPKWLASEAKAWVRAKKSAYKLPSVSTT